MIAFVKAFFMQLYYCWTLLLYLFLIRHVYIKSMIKCILKMHVFAEISVTQTFIWIFLKSVHVKFTIIPVYFCLWVTFYNLTF